jgi:hypothetical protein
MTFVVRTELVIVKFYLTAELFILPADDETDACVQEAAGTGSDGRLGASYTL